MIEANAKPQYYALRRDWATAVFSTALERLGIIYLKSCRFPGFESTGPFREVIPAKP